MSKIKNRKRVSSALLGLGLVLAATASAQPFGSQDEDRPIPIGDFVRQQYIHGVPWHGALRYGVDEIPQLTAMLADPQELDHWSNIAITLAIVGDESVLPTLTAFIEADPGAVLVPRHYLAKKDALMALGYLAYNTGSQAVLDYLAAGIDPGRWQQASVGWLSPFHASALERDQHLSELAIIGLALSGSVSADQTLRSLQRPSKNPTAQAFLDRVEELVGLAIETSEFIREHGMAAHQARIGHVDGGDEAEG